MNASLRTAAVLLVLNTTHVTATRAATVRVPEDQPTIQLGIANSGAGDTVDVACGTYYENIIMKAGVMVRSRTGDPECATIDGNGITSVARFEYLALPTRLEGFTLTNGRSGFSNGSAISAYFANVVVAHCSFRHHLGTNSVIRLESSTLDASWTEIVQNSGSAFETPGALVSYPSTLSMRNCTIADNSINVSTSSFDVFSFDECIFSGEGCPGGTKNFCCIYPCAVTGTNFSADPRFCNAANDDYGLQPGSPCLPGGQTPKLIGTHSLSPGCGAPADVDYIVTTDPPGLPVIVDGTTHTSPVTLTWQQYSSHTLNYQTAQVSADTRYRFGSWSDAGAQSHLAWAPAAPSTFTADLIAQYTLAMMVSGNGTVLPPDDWFDEAQSVPIQALAQSDAYFTDWTGSGPGSFTGVANPANVVMGGPISQTAHFAPISYDFTISASDTDPFQFRAPPTNGPRNLYLWLTCANSAISAFEAGVTGTLTPVTFIALGGALNAGSETDLLLAIPNCPSGESTTLLLGLWVVDDHGGTLCLGRSARSGQIAGVNCLFTFDTIKNPHTVGFSSAGAPGCGITPDRCGDRLLAETHGELADPTPSGAIEPWRAAPNPFAEETSIGFELAESAVVQLRVYDVSGRLVHALSPSALDAGRHSLSWNGLDASGSPVQSGTYFVRLTTGGRTETRKVTLLRTR